MCRKDPDRLEKVFLNETCRSNYDLNYRLGLGEGD